MAQETIMKAYRGPASGLPTLEAGQFGVTTDKNQVWVGDGVTNHLVGPYPVIKQFTTAMTQANFVTMVADMTIDVIEMAAGTYQDWVAVDISVDRSARPLLIRPAPGANVVWDGTTDLSSDGVFYFGITAKASYITFDPSGTGGSFTIQNYNLGQTGVVNTLYCDHITMNGFIIKKISDTVNDGNTRWALYLQHDASNNTGSYLIFNDWNFDSDSGDGFVNGVAFHMVSHVVIKRWKIRGGKYAAYGVSGSTLSEMDSWTVYDVTTPYDFSNGDTVTIKDCTFIHSGNVVSGAGVTDGGGNIFITATGLALLDDANAAAQLTTLGAAAASHTHAESDVTNLTTDLAAKLDKAGGTLSGDITLGENTGINLDPAGSADEKWSGITVTGTAGATLAVGDLCYLDVTAAEWLLADADAAATAGSVVLGICILAATDGNATRMLLIGTIRSAAFPASIALGAPVYVSTTAGDLTATQPSGTDDVIRVVGWAVSAEPNTIYFCPSADYITHV